MFSSGELLPAGPASCIWILLSLTYVYMTSAPEFSAESAPHDQKLLDIQKDSAAAVGALAMVGATVAISLMYSRQ